MWNTIKRFIQEPTGAALAKGGSIVLFFKVVGALGGYVLLFSLAKVGGELSVGIYEVAFTVVLIGSTVARWGLDTVLVREMAKDHQAELSSRKLYLNVLGRVLVLSAVVALGSYLGATYLTNLFFQNTPQSVIATAAITVVPFTLMLLNAEVFRAMGRSLLFSLNQHGTVYIIIGGLLFFLLLMKTTLLPLRRNFHCSSFLSSLPYFPLDDFLHSSTAERASSANTPVGIQAVYLRYTNAHFLLVILGH